MKGPESRLCVASALLFFNRGCQVNEEENEYIILQFVVCTSQLDSNDLIFNCLCLNLSTDDKW